MACEAKYPGVLPGLELIHQGKTRDTYRAGDKRLVVASDRLSTHNVVHLSEVPRKGEVLTALTVFWLKQVLEPEGVIHHLKACGRKIYDHLPGKPSDYPADLHHRAIVVQDLAMLPVEMIFRNYLAGSLYDKFHAKKLANPYGVVLPADMQLMKPFGLPVFTPTDKSETDDPLNAAAVNAQYPEAVEMARKAFILIGNYLRDRDMELVDSKFELGVDQTKGVVLADEIATPDSSRFTQLSLIKIGENPEWLDKQVARDEAEHIWGKGLKVPLQFDLDVVRHLTQTYHNVFGEITGVLLEEFQAKWFN